MKKLMLLFWMMIAINTLAQRHQKQESLHIKAAQPYNVDALLNAPVKGIPSSSKARPKCNLFFNCTGRVTQKQPLFVIDETISTYNDFIKIKPKNIVEVFLIKDQEAISIYGDDANDGAIIITTKSDVIIRLEEINKKQDSIINLTYPVPGALQKP